MSDFIANARMYAVTAAVEADWRTLLERIASMADVPLPYYSYPAPQPLEALWQRPDVGCVHMCGYPIALHLASVVPLAAPVLALPWAKGLARYRSDLIVHEDAPFRTIEDTFGGRAAWTVQHSHSGFNAFRHHLLPFRTPERPTLYREVRGNLVTARAILDAVREELIDIGPLDAYWHWLIRRHAPELTRGIRVLESTALAPIPAFVAAPSLGAPAIERLKAAFANVHRDECFAPIAERLGLNGFVPVTQDDFAVTLQWDREAHAAGYPLPA